MTKTQQTGRKENFLNLIYENPPGDAWNKAMMPTLSIQHCYEDPGRCKKARKRKRHKDLKGTKLSLFRDEMTVYVENPK